MVVVAGKEAFRTIPVSLSLSSFREGGNVTRQKWIVVVLVQRRRDGGIWVTGYDGWEARHTHAKNGRTGALKDKFRGVVVVSSSRARLDSSFSDKVTTNPRGLMGPPEGRSGFGLEWVGKLG